MDLRPPREGDTYLLPSGNVVRVSTQPKQDAMISCDYKRCAWTRAYKGVQFTAEWLRRFGVRQP